VQVPRRQSGSRSQVEEGVQFTLQDDYGIDHEYYTILHPAGTGWQLALKLVKLLGPTLGAVLGEINLGNVLESMGEVSKAATDGAELDLSTVGERLSTLAGHILQDQAIVSQVFEHTRRDNIEVMVAFDSAYQGNYGELIQALYQVIKANFGPLFQRHLGKRSTIPQATGGSRTSTATQLPS
jgi:hypothetical protein